MMERASYYTTIERKPCTKPFDATETESEDKLSVSLCFNYWMDHAHINDGEVAGTVFGLLFPPARSEYFQLVTTFEQCMYLFVDCFMFLQVGKRH